ncbi:hypothetical protein [Desulfothermobacter acidiphilus]|uniref:hypothetical protein n=1 Tax=Desulfothermobacter acidiphilus TaxID=1938353 RepID=UPI003F8C010B
MRVKKYRARDMQEALSFIRRDLGPEAVIISTRRVRGLPRFWESCLEVVAAVDEQRREESSSMGWLERELTEVKALIHRLAQRPQEEVPRSLSPGARRWQECLAALEVENELLGLILQRLDGDGEEPALEESIAELISPFYSVGELERVLALVGPTGVGKTTTLAKLAARLSLYQHRRVVLLTIDTYRIGAVEQLRTYAEVMGLPFGVAMTPAELSDLLQRYPEADHFLVDTVGRPGRRGEEIAELREFLQVLPPSRGVGLVLSLNTRYRDMVRTAEAFRELGYNKLVFTKLDETDSWGAMLSLVYRLRVPALYITTGQSVPDDIEFLSPRRLARLLVERGECHARSGT